MIRCPTCQKDNLSDTLFCIACGTRLLNTRDAVSLRDAPTKVRPHQVVLQDRYVVLQKLGQGGMSAVYLVGDRRLSTANWAVKEMSLAALADSADLQVAREAFRREAELLAALSHPHLPRVIDHFEQEGKAYLVMEYLPGETLLSYLQREGGPQPVARVLGWAYQLCDVLEYLHTQSPPVIFRDLKPMNMMMSPQGDIKLIDFGIARFFKPGKTRDTQEFGTVGYSAPEQYGSGQTDARADIYSLGVVIHQMLTGYDPTRTPFRLPLANQLNPDVPAQLAAVLATATDSDIAHRFATIRAFRDALHASSQEPRAALAVSSDPRADHNTAPTQVLTTRLANSSRWIGIASITIMLTAMGAALFASIQQKPTDAMAGFAYLLAFPALLLGPLACALGILALTRSETRQTIDGRFHAIMGTTTGVATFLLCCVIAAIIGSVS